MKKPAAIQQWKKLPPAFYQRNDVVEIAYDLIGKILVTRFNDHLTAGRIVETEAYNGIVDKASHAHNNRRTKRTEIMYAAGGVAYVYLCYGLHQMFNIVTNKIDIPAAVLIRSLEPVCGIEVMLERTRKKIHGSDLTRGPGNVAKALGLHTTHSGLSLQSDELFVASEGSTITTNEIVTTARIGVDYAAEDALLPYRFFERNNRYVSGKKTLNYPVDNK